MSLFKEKKSKVDATHYKRETIDAKHTEYTKKFSSIKTKVTECINELNNIKSKLEILENKKKMDLSDTDLELMFNLREEYDTLHKKINNYQNNIEEKSYYLETAHLMFNYYDKFNNNYQSSANNYYKNKKKPNDLNNKSVLDFFKNKNTISPITNNIRKSNLDNKHIYTKSEIINSYLMKVEDNFIYPFDIDNSLEYCKKCNKEKTIIASEGIIVCTSCGQQSSIIIDSDKPSYKDPPREISYFAYKRINHFNEWLAQFQAKESTEIPQMVFDKILLEIKKERIENMATLSPIKLREILKKLKLNKYYEHVPHIINRLNGLPAPVMTRDTEEKLRMMFKEIQTPFLKYCPKERKNFLSYAYVLHKFVQLLEMDEFLICFPLLKSREKLHQQDQIWKNICEELQWEFIKSL